MQATLSKWGNSQGIRLPKGIIQDLNLVIGEKMNISYDNKKITFEPIRNQKIKYDLTDLLAKMPDDYQVNEVFNDSQGIEAW